MRPNDNPVLAPDIRYLTDDEIVQPIILMDTEEHGVGGSSPPLGTRKTGGGQFFRARRASKLLCLRADENSGDMFPQLKKSCRLLFLKQF